MARAVGLGDLDPGALRRDDDEGVVGAEVADLLDAPGKQVVAHAGRPLLADADLLGPHGNSHRHVQRAADTVPDVDLADGRAGSAAVGLVQRELALEQVDVADEPGHEAVGRVFIDLLWRAHLQHPALAHDGDAAGHGHGLFLVVGDHDHRHTHLLDDVDQLELGLLAQLLVQRTQGLVQQQQLGPLGQAARQRHTLLLTARELVRLAPGVGRELHQRQHLVHALLDLCLGQAFALEAEGDVLPDVQVREQGIALEHHVHRPVVGRPGHQVLAAEQDAPGGRLLEAGQHAQQRRLAAARTAQQRKNLALADGQRDLVNRHSIVEALDQFFRHQIAVLLSHVRPRFLMLDAVRKKRAAQPRGLNSPASRAEAQRPRLKAL